MSNQEFNKSEELFIVPESLGSLVISETIKSGKKSPELLFLRVANNLFPIAARKRSLLM